MHYYLGTSYLPGRVYTSKIIHGGEVTICGGTPWQKQTLRNRTFILSPNGIQRLIVPVKHAGNEKLTDAEMRIDYSLPWIREHKGALEAAYNSSPFFEYFRDELFAVYDRMPEFLFDLNFHLLQLIFKKMKKTVRLTEERQESMQDECFDLINRKMQPDDSGFPQYPQVFAYKSGFTKGLSVLDQLANIGG